MRILALTLLPAALALTGAAPPQALSLGDLAHCRLTHDQAALVVKDQKVLQSRDGSDSKRKMVTRIFEAPADLTVLGYPATRIGASEIGDQDGEKLFVMSIVQAPFDEVQQRVLAAAKVDRCYHRVEGGNNCFVSKREREGWIEMFFITQHDDDVTISCQYSPARR